MTIILDLLLDLLGRLLFQQVLHLSDFCQPLTPPIVLLLDLPRVVYVLHASSVLYYDV